MFLSSADFFFFFFAKSTFTKNYFRITIRVSNSLGTDQALRFVGPDLCPNCCIGYQQTALVGKEFKARTGARTSDSSTQSSLEFLHRATAGSPN